MLEPHPPHATPHSWRDFFIHIATIVIGLLIAIGLEQTVEWFHLRHQLKEARQRLSFEDRANQVIFHAQYQETERYLPLLQRNIEVFEYLRTHPGAPPNAWPGRLSFLNMPVRFRTAVFEGVRNDGLLARMPPKEEQQISALYGSIDQLNSVVDAEQPMIWRCIRFAARHEQPQQMTPAELDQAIEDTTMLMQQYTLILTREMNLSRENRQFSPGPDLREVRAALNFESPPEELARINQIAHEKDRQLAPIDAEAEKH